MPEHCKTCAYWIAPSDPNECTAGEYDEVFDRAKLPFEVRECKHPEKSFCEPPKGPDGFATLDGSGYRAALYTGENFGCLRWTEASDAEK